MNFSKRNSGNERYELVISKKFKKQAQKLTENKPNLKRKVNKTVRDFSESGRQAQSYRKKLKGNLMSLEELEVTGDIRIFVMVNDLESIAVLEKIGTHSQLGI